MQVFSWVICGSAWLLPVFFQTAAQPEGAVLNFVNWAGNLIAPVGGALAVVMAVVAYSQGRRVVTAGGSLVISGLPA